MSHTKQYCTVGWVLHGVVCPFYYQLYSINIRAIEDRAVLMVDIKIILTVSMDVQANKMMKQLGFLSSQLDERNTLPSVLGSVFDSWYLVDKASPTMYLICASSNLVLYSNSKCPILVKEISSFVNEGQAFQFQRQI